MVPVPMIKEVLAKTNGIELILEYGLYHAARKQKTYFESVTPLRQLMYCYYRDTEALTPSLKKRLDELVEEELLFIDEDYHGFNGTEFNPEEEMNALYSICEEDTDFREEIWEWYDLLQFYKLVNLVLNGRAMAEDISVVNRYDEYTGEPYAMISPNFLIDLRDKCRTEKDRVRVAMLLAICSIIGTKRFAATTKKHIVSRMFGAKNDAELQKNLSDKSLYSCYQKYTTRKVFDKLRDELLSKNMIKCYHGHAGRVYVSNQFRFSELVDEIAEFIRKCTSPTPNWKSNESELTKRLTSINKGAP